jgi:peptidyl-prolyl cis-trans isomerase SurA
MSAEAKVAGVKKGQAPLIIRGRMAATAGAALWLALSGAGPVRAQDTAPPPAPTPASAPTPSMAPPLGEGVFATVNDDIISTYDLRQRMRLLFITSGVQPTQENVQQIQAEALRSLEDEHLEMQEVRRQEKEQKFTITASDQDINEDIKRMAQGNRMTAEQLIDTLRRAGVDPNTLRDQLRADISWQHWVYGRYGGSRLKISQAQINGVFDQIQAEAAKPQFQVSEIFIDATRVGGMDRAIDGANQLVAQIQQGAPFAAVARQFSQSSTAANGGDAGWISESQLPTEVRAAVEQLGPGQLSRPIPVKDGVFIILVRDKRAGAGADLVSLKQAAIALPADAPPQEVAAAQRKLEALRGQINGCDTVEKAAAKVDGVVAGDLGEANVKDLRPAFRDAAEDLKVGQVSEPIRTDVGLHLIAVCGRRQSGLQLPTREEVENKLTEDELTMISRRMLRDLRNSATIETR